jgi:hypothetical protein
MDLFLDSVEEDILDRPILGWRRERACVTVAATSELVDQGFVACVQCPELSHPPPGLRMVGVSAFALGKDAPQAV